MPSVTSRVFLAKIFIAPIKHFSKLLPYKILRKVKKRDGSESGGERRVKVRVEEREGWK